jgi:prolipoprotein diacylglyceryltransferase
LFFIYIVSYSLSQIGVFFLRDNEVVFLGLKQAQLTAAATIIVALAVFFWLYRRHKKAQLQVIKEETPGENQSPQV